MSYKLTKHSQICYEYIKDNITYELSSNLVTKYNNLIEKFHSKIETNENYIYNIEKNNTISSSLKKTDICTLVKIIRNIPKISIPDIDNLTDDILSNDEKLIEWLVNNHMNMHNNLSNNNIRSDINIDKLNRLLYDNPFVPLNIQHYSETHNLDFSHITYSSINIYLYEILSKCPKVDPTRIIRIYEFMKNISGKNIDFELVLFLSPCKKIISLNIRFI